MKKIFISLVLVFCIILSFIFVQLVNQRKERGPEPDETADLPQTFITDRAGDSNEIIILKVAHKFPESHPQHIALTQKFVPQVESGSNWTIRVEIYPNQQLGNEAAYVDGLRKGTLEMCIGSQSIAGLLPNIGMLELPYLFDSYEQFGKIMNSREGNIITEGLEGLGLRNLGWTHYGFRQISLTTVYLQGDSRRIKLGTDGSLPNRQVLDAMGFDPGRIDMKQLSVAIDQSLVEGHDFPLITAYYNGWTDSLAYLLKTNHVLVTDMYLVNEAFWSGLTSEQRSLITEVVGNTVAYESELISITEKKILNSLTAEKIPIVPFDSTKIRNEVHDNNMHWIGDDKILKDLYARIIM